MERVYARQNLSGANDIKDALSKHGAIELHNEHETFYGFGFDGWLEKLLADIKCKIEIVGHDKWYGFPNKFIVTLI